MIILFRSLSGATAESAPLPFTPSLRRLFGDDLVESRVCNVVHLPNGFLESFFAHGGLEVLCGFPLGDIDEAEFRLWVEALVEPGGEKARLVSHQFGGCAPFPEE